MEGRAADRAAYPYVRRKPRGGPKPSVWNTVGLDMDEHGLRPPIGPTREAAHQQAAAARKEQSWLRFLATVVFGVSCVVWWWAYAVLFAPGAYRRTSTPETLRENALFTGDLWTVLDMATAQVRAQALSD